MVINKTLFGVNFFKITDSFNFAEQPGQVS